MLRAHAVPRWLWSAHALNTDNVPTRGPSPSTRARGATYQLRPPRISPLLLASASALLRLLFLGKRRSTQTHCVRAVPHWLSSVYTLAKDTAPTRGLCHFGARPLCDVPAEASQNQPMFAWHTRARRCARCLSGGGAVRKVVARARRVALVVIGRCTRQGRRAFERSLYFDAQSWCDKPAASCQSQPSFVWNALTRYCACCFSGGGTARKLVARAPCRAGYGRHMH